MLLLLAGGGLFGQQPATRRICDTIHYEYKQEKIIIPVIVNGVEVKYIVDTGGQTGTMREEAVKMQAKVSGVSRNVSDLNNIGANYASGVLENVQLSTSYRLSRLNTLIFPYVGFFKELGVAGILGGDAFAESVLTFDTRQQIMVINYPYRPTGLKITDGMQMFPGAANHSFVRADLNGLEKEVLFDTGAHGFLILSTDDCEELQAKGGCQVVNKAYGISGTGIAGLGKPTDIVKLNVPELTLGSQVFRNVGNCMTVTGKSIIGVDLLKYGKVVIDYMRHRFYFFPYAEGPVDLGGAPVTWNVGVLPMNGHFGVSTIWKSLKGQVEFGDQVVNINGHSLEGFPQSEPEINRLMDEIPGTSGYIIVLKDGKEKRIEIKKEQ